MQHPAAEAQEDSEDKDEVDEDGEEDDFVDEDFGEDNGERKIRSGSCPIARTITLQMLLADRLLQPGEGAMSIEYMGQRFVGDLLHDGKIRSQETGIVFLTPSAWAVNCKRIINPIKRSGCGWASVRYKGRKLDAYKNIWINRRNEERNQGSDELYDDDSGTDKENIMITPTPSVVAAPRPPLPPTVRVPVKHHTVGNRTSMIDPNMLVECTSFSTMGKIQPFLISISTNVVLVMDFHCHLTTSEVCGYLAGQWDVSAHNLAVTHAFPCRARLDDKANALLVEKEIRIEMDKRGLVLVGWYHSHPMLPPAPSLRDIDKQLDYEMQMKGSSDSSYTPCIGIICSPYHQDAASLESSIVSFWVAPPPENKPLEYGKPMLMSYSVVQDAHLTCDVIKELTALVEFYKDMPDFIKLTSIYKNNTTFLEKMKVSLTPKFPRDQEDGTLWGFIRQLVTPGEEERDSDGNIKMYEPVVATSSSTATTLAIPMVQVGNRNSNNSSNSVGSNTHTSSGINSVSTSTSNSSSSSGAGYFMGADVANAILAAGKLPAGTSLMSVMPGTNQTTNLSSAASMFLSPAGLNLLGNVGNSANKGGKGSSSNSTSHGGLSLSSLAALGSLGNLGNLGVSIANLANLNNLNIGNLSLGSMSSLANISLSNKSSSSGIRSGSAMSGASVTSSNRSTSSAEVNHSVNNSVSMDSSCLTMMSATPLEPIKTQETNNVLLSEGPPSLSITAISPKSATEDGSVNTNSEISVWNNHSIENSSDSRKDLDSGPPAKLIKFDASTSLHLGNDSDTR